MCQINETHPQDPNTGQLIPDKWKAKALQFDTRLLVLADHLGGIEGNGPFEAKVAGHPVVSNCPAYSNPSPEEIHIVAHTPQGDRDADSFFVDGQRAGKKLIILHVSSAGPVATESEEKPDSVWLTAKDLGAYKTESDKWVKQFLSLTYEDAKKLLPPQCKERSSVPSEIEGKCPEFLDIIFPGRIENRLAFRLLREAKNACGEKEIVANFNGTGLTINAPKTLEDWRNPFGDDDAKALRHLARCIIDETGEGNVEKKNAVKAEVATANAGKLRSAIESYLNITSEASTQA
jgi:hypothetical protein